MDQNVLGCLRVSKGLGVQGLEFRGLGFRQPFRNMKLTDSCRIWHSFVQFPCRTMKRSIQSSPEAACDRLVASTKPAEPPSPGFGV